VRGGGAIERDNAERSLSLLIAEPPFPLLGDAFNPSLISAATQGAHMVPVLNACKVDVAMYGYVITSLPGQGSAAVATTDTNPMFPAERLSPHYTSQYGRPEITTLIL
jgi:hypothetical protein